MIKRYTATAEVRECVGTSSKPTARVMLTHISPVITKRGLILSVDWSVGSSKYNTLLLGHQFNCDDRSAKSLIFLNIIFSTAQEKKNQLNLALLTDPIKMLFHNIKCISESYLSLSYRNKFC